MSRSLAGELRFYAENIEVTLCPPDTVAVSGEYFFTSSDSTPCKQRVTYPFPADPGAEPPCLTSVKQHRSVQEIPFNRIENGISFGVDVPANDTVAITVMYRQRFTNKTGRYILTTTDAWGRPLSNSTYFLRVPVTTNLDYLSYECDTVYTAGAYRVYSFFKKKFMPERDFVFSWQDEKMQ